MRFYTIAWADGALPDDEAEAVPARYAAHVATLAPALPPHLHNLALGRPSLHDGKFGGCHVDHRRRRVTLALRCGDQQEGYVDVELTYDGVEVTRLDRDALRAAVVDPSTELIYDEVDREAPGRFVHRLLFFPFREADVTFESLRVETRPRPDRAADRPEARYVEIGAPAV